MTALAVVVGAVVLARGLVWAHARYGARIDAQLLELERRRLYRERYEAQPYE